MNCIAIILLLLASTALAPRPEEEATVRISFAYKGAGIGPLSSDVVVIENNSEEYVASRVIRESLSSLGYRVLPHAGDGVVLLSRSKQYSSAPLTLSKDDVAAYNEAVDSNLRLPTDYIYASSVALRYEVDTRRQHFEISLDPALHVRGASSEFASYDRAFDRRFFTDRIKKSIRDTFDRLCPAPTGCVTPK